MKFITEYLMPFIAITFLGFFMLAVWDSSNRTLWTQISLTMVPTALMLHAYVDFVKGRTHLRKRNSPEERSAREREILAAMQDNDSLFNQPKQTTDVQKHN